MLIACITCGMPSVTGYCTTQCREATESPDMGSMSRRKGRRFENTVASELNTHSPATRISEAGSPGPDIQWMQRVWECKSRKSYASMNYYVKQLEDSHGVFLKENGGRILALMPLDELLDMMDEIGS